MFSDWLPNIALSSDLLEKNNSNKTVFLKNRENCKSLVILQRFALYYMKLFVNENVIRYSIVYDQKVIFYPRLI